jgi:hypothetical protein
MLRQAPDWRPVLHVDGDRLLVRTHGIDTSVIQRDAEHFSVETPQGVEGLILRRSGHLAVHGKRRQECLDLSRTPILRMAYVMTQEVLTHPADVGAFRMKRVTSQPHDLLSLIEPFRLGPYPCV